MTKSKIKKFEIKATCEGWRPHRLGKLVPVLIIFLFYV